MKKHHDIRAGSCLACGSEALKLGLDLGEQPLANNLLESRNQAYKSFPLSFNWCQDCGHGQLGHFADPLDLFSHYLYASNTSRTLNEYFEWFADEAAKMIATNARILEIGCNDGSLLSCFQRHGFDVNGVDPAQNLVQLARQHHLNVTCDFWPTNDFDGMHFDLIVAQNVLAHTPTPLQFLTKVRDVMSNKGVCLIQTSQAAMLTNGEFDTIYHEHCSFFTGNSMHALAARAGLVLRRINLVNIHGISFLFWLTKPDFVPDDSDIFTSAPFGLPNLAVPGPELHGKVVDLEAAYDLFGDRARARMQETKEVVEGFRQRGLKICLIGAAAKAITFMHAANLQPDYIFDEAPLKIGRFIPGTDSPIQSLADLAQIQEPCAFVISAWNFRSELERKVRALYKFGYPEFLIYFPKLEKF